LAAGTGTPLFFSLLRRLTKPTLQLVHF
jgi:hypothetical protein